MTNTRSPNTMGEVYSSELFCGMSSEVIRGATGQMSELVGG
jgi:hypothetical protein